LGKLSGWRANKFYITVFTTVMTEKKEEKCTYGEGQTQEFA